MCIIQTMIDLAKRWLQAACTYMYNLATKLQIPNTMDNIKCGKYIKTIKSSASGFFF